GRDREPLVGIDQVRIPDLAPVRIVDVRPEERVAEIAARQVPQRVAAPHDVLRLGLGSPRAVRPFLGSQPAREDEDEQRECRRSDQGVHGRRLLQKGRSSSASKPALPRDAPSVRRDDRSPSVDSPTDPPRVAHVADASGVPAPPLPRSLRSCAMISVAYRVGPAASSQLRYSIRPSTYSRSPFLTNRSTTSARRSQATIRCHSVFSWS